MSQLRFTHAALLTLSVAIGCMSSPTEPSSDQQRVQDEAPRRCQYTKVEADPQVNAAFDRLVAEHKLVTGRRTETLVGRNGMISTADFTVVDQTGAPVAAGTLTCTLAGCENAGDPEVDEDYCKRDGCRPNTAGDDCTPATCEGSLCRTSPTCTRAISTPTDDEIPTLDLR